MDATHIFILFSTITLSLFCVLGNLVTIIAITVDIRLKKSVTNYCVVSLAIADIIVGSIIIPFRGYYEFNDKIWIFGHLFCDIWYSINISTCTASILNLCIICLDRYISIFDSFNYKSRLSERKVMIYIFMIWFISIAISFPAMLRSWVDNQTDDTKNSSDQCMLFLSEKSYMMMACAVTFYIPLMFMSYVYIKIYLKASNEKQFIRRGTKITKDRKCGNEVSLRIHSSTNLQELNQINSCNRIPGQNKWITRQDRAAKTLGIVFGAFLICWLPFFIKFPIYMFTNDSGQPDTMLSLFNWLGWFNSCLNPLIYYFWSREFRRAFKQVGRNVISLFYHDHVPTSLELRNPQPSLNALGQGK